MTDLSSTNVLEKSTHKILVTKNHKINLNFFLYIQHIRRNFLPVAKIVDVGNSVATNSYQKCKRPRFFNFQKNFYKLEFVLLRSRQQIACVAHPSKIEINILAPEI